MNKLLTIVIVVTFSLFAKAQTFTWSGSIPLLDFQTDTIPVTVSGLPNVINGSFGIGHSCITILHTYDSDVTVKLMSPDGSIVILIQNQGLSNDNFIGTCVAMDGTDFNNLIPPYTGLVVPVGNLSNLNNGQNPNGIWKFIVSDVANNDVGTIQELNLEFTNNPPGGTTNNGGPTGVAVCATCVCPGGAAGCDLLPDMTSSAKEIQVNHQETPGFLDISNATPNIGYGPIEIYGIDSCFCGTTHVPCGTICPGGDDIQHVVKQRIYQKVPGTDTLSYYDRFAGTMTYHATHGHIHVDDWAEYTLRSATANPDPKTWPIIGTGTKQSFCLINLGSCSGNPGECLDNNGNTILTVPNNGVGFHTGCGLNQGIYPGQYDVYSMGLNEPIILNNVCNGTYYIVSITDPHNNFLESDETNNVVAVPITLTQQNATPSITPSGSTTICPGDSVTLTSNIASNYLWSTGATTRSIVVYTAGSYTVSSSCGASTQTSSPVVVTLISPNTAPSVIITITNGSNPMCLNASLTLTATPTNGGSTPFYQWKVNGNNVGSNSPTYTASNYVNGQVVTCVMTSSLNCVTTPNATSNSITMQVGSTICYCVPAYGTSGNAGCLDGDVIAHVTLNTLDNLSGAGCPSGIAGYSDYSSSSNPLHTTTLQAGNNYNCTVWTGQYGEGYAVWIDYNNDGTFSPTEKIGNTTTVVNGSGSVGVIGSSRVIPVIISCSAPAGTHRMRVRCIYNLAGPTIDPCILQSTWGETEDYTITITAAPGCPKPTVLTATNVTSSSAVLGWTKGCAETLWNVHVTSAGGGAPSGAPSYPGVGNPFTVTGLSPSTQYEYWVSADCNSAGNGTSQWTGPVTFTTIANCASVPGSSMANPILIGEAPCVSAPYVNTQTNSTANCFSNNYLGANTQASPDIWYKFTLSATATVQVSHCNTSGLSDSYLHLLNAAGTQLLFNDDNGPLCTGNRASLVATNLAPGTYYVVSEGFNTGVGSIRTTINTTNACITTSVLNLNAFIEGFYISGGQMGAVLFLNGFSTDPSVCDTITVDLHNSTPPYAVVSSVKTLLHTDGSSIINFPVSLINQSFYIAIRHRNAIETWSANPVLISAVKSYDFTTDPNKAYGNNLADMGDGRFALFSGDISDATLGVGYQDGVIESQDYGDIENAVSVTLLGYHVEDLTGDKVVESDDYVLMENNLFFTRVVMRP